jgi:hypothetical protein
MMTLPDLVAACKAAYNPEPEMVHLDTMANWTSLFQPLLPKTVKGQTKPHCFVVRRDRMGVVRHHYRQQMQTRKAEEPTCWFPTDGPGHCLLENPPDLSKLVNVPFKPVDEKELKDVIKMSSPYLSTEQENWWNDTLDAFVAEDSLLCETCVGLRQCMKDNGKCKSDSKEEARRKSSLWQEARSDMMTHLSGPNEQHWAFRGKTKPEANFRWVPSADGGGHYVDEFVDEPEVDEQMQELREEVDRQMEEFVPNHHVGSVDSRAERRPEKLEVGHVVVIRREVDPDGPGLVDGSSDKAWYLGEVLKLGDSSMQPLPDDAGAEAEMVLVHDWGNKHDTATTGSEHCPVYKGETKKRSRWVAQNEFHKKGGIFHLPKGARHRNWEAQTSWVDHGAVVDYGVKKDMVVGKLNKVTV